MAVVDALERVGSSLVDGLKATGRVAGAVLPAVGKAVVNEEAGYAPQIAAEQRQQATGMDDAAIGAHAKLLESQLGQLQSSAPLYKADGTVMTPQERSDALSSLSDQYTQLYSHPKHAPLLMEKLRQIVHPNGARAGQDLPQATNTPAKAMAGFTAASPGGEQGDESEQEKQVKQIDFFKKNMLPLFPAEQQSKKLNEYIDHLNGLKEGAEPKPPKGLKAMEQGGVFFGVEDQDSGKQYMKEQLEAGGDAPDAAKKMYQAVQKASEDKQKATDKKEEDRRKDEDHRNQQAEERQNRIFAHTLQMQTVGIQKMMEIGDYREARKEISKADEGYQASVDRAGSMDTAAQKAKQGDQQAMFAVLSNHIAMTLQQPGVSARPTKAMYDEAAGSLPWMQNVMKKFDKDGYLTGLVLTPDQIDKMVDLGHQKVETQKKHVERLKTEFKDDLNPTVPGTNKPVRKGGVGRALTAPAPPSASKHKIKIGDKMYTYNGSGDTADLKNYTEVPK